jgi:hypothetical protein
MTARKVSTHAVRLGVALAVLAAVPACAAAGHEARLTAFQPRASNSKPVTINRAKLLHPTHKYYGIFTPGAPAKMTSITGEPPDNSVTSETGKQPNLDLYFQAWNSGATTGKANFSVKTASNDCAAGLLPMYTWESWNTADKGPNIHNGKEIDNTPLWAQKAFAPHKIIVGKYDAYIRATADAMKTLQCPIAIRFDQEPNGYWYPWGVTTTGMPGAPDVRAKRYVKMWRHVVTIFRNQGATNVMWVWSPNFQSLAHTGYPDLSATYPGDKYVDWVGIDGYYYNNPNQTFKGLFGTTITQLKPFAKNEPWLIAETGVGSYDDPSVKPAQITNLLHAVAHRKRFNGLIYFDQEKANDRSNWKFDETQASLDAFKAGISNDVYAAGKPGSLQSDVRR